jgi:glycosyltransferase involved in cell wall biosynthesis
VRVCLVADSFALPYDEGFKKIAYRLALEFDAANDFLAIAPGGGSATFRLASPRTNRLFASRALGTVLREFDPDILVYLPFASFTRNSFIRCRVLSAFVPRSRLIMLGVQARSWSRQDLVLMRWWQPHHVLTPLPLAVAQLNGAGIAASLLPFGVDTDKFSPVANMAERAALREKYGLAIDARVYLHVGQITAKRNVLLLANLVDTGTEVVVVGSSSSAAQGFPHDAEVVEYLESRGVKVWIRYFEKVQELYRLADCYLFPTFHETGGIGFPLSVLEALACGTTVVTTRFGGLPAEFANRWPLQFGDSDAELVALARAVKLGPSSEAPALVSHLCWPAIAGRILAHAQTGRS